MSLYGNNDSLLKENKDIVKGGSVIALVGNSGGNLSNGLYYELRKNSKPFNPLKWTTLK
jgi:septal ring factor EnvC (AmiA/AmiB activator)